MSIAAPSRLNWWSEAACQYADPGPVLPGLVDRAGRGGSQGQADLRPLPGPRTVPGLRDGGGIAAAGHLGRDERPGPGPAAAQSPPRGAGQGTGAHGLTAAGPAGRWANGRAPPAGRGQSQSRRRKTGTARRPDDDDQGRGQKPDARPKPG